MIRIYNYKFNIDDYSNCPKCGEHKFWEGYCEACGYSTEE